MKITRTILLALSAACLLHACKKDPVAPDPPPVPPGPSGSSINITGRVVDINEAFIANATVSCNGQTATSDASGIFRMTGVPTVVGRNYLKVEKDGYFFGGRNFYPVGGGEVNIRVVLASRTQIGSFQASAGGTVQTSDGLTIEIPANGIEGGYQGEVRVFAKYLDPTATNTILEIPGLEGLNASGDNGILRPFGMGHIELADPGGMPLQLATGAAALLNVPVPPTLLASAPQTIPLWYFDESVGIWKEEGSATLQGGVYVGEVQHFSLWNCDDFMCSYRFQMNLSCGGIPVANMPVVIRSLTFNSGLTGTGVSNSQGQVISHLPCNAELEIFVVPPGSNGTEYLLGTIQTSVTAQDNVEIVSLEGLCGPHASVQGQAVNASGLPVTNGYMYLRFDDLYTEPVFFDAQGNFTASFFDYTSQQLSTGAQIVAWDMATFTMLEGPIIPFNEQLNVLPAPLVIGGGPASTSGRIYATGHGPNGFYCMNASTGATIWSLSTPSMRRISPAFWNNRVYFITLSGELFCVNAGDGSELWSNFGYSDTYAPFIEDGVLYIASNYGNVKAIDALTGSLLWQYNTGGSGLFSAPTIVGNTLYCGGNDANPGVFALNKADGSLLWEWSAPDEVNTSPCVSEGKVFFGCNDQKYYALDAATGTPVWEREVDTGTNMLGAPTAGPGVVHGHSRTKLFALNASNGEIIWIQNRIAHASGGHPYLSGNRLFAGAASGQVPCLNAADGSLMYMVQTSGASAQHFLVADGVLFLNAAGTPATLEARNAQTGALIWTGGPQSDLTSPMVLVDDNGVVHYSTASGMRQ